MKVVRGNQHRGRGGKTWWNKEAHCKRNFIRRGRIGGETELNSGAAHHQRGQTVVGM